MTREELDQIRERAAAANGPSYPIECWRSALNVPVLLEEIDRLRAALERIAAAADLPDVGVEFCSVTARFVLQGDTQP